MTGTNNRPPRWSRIWIETRLAGGSPADAWRALAEHGLVELDPEELVPAPPAEVPPRRPLGSRRDGPAELFGRLPGPRAPRASPAEVASLA